MVKYCVTWHMKSRDEFISLTANVAMTFKWIISLVLRCNVVTLSITIYKLVKQYLMLFTMHVNNRMMQCKQTITKFTCNLTWHLHTTSALTASMSTTLPLPSSPHCVPNTTVTVLSPILARLAWKVPFWTIPFWIICAIFSQRSEKNTAYRTGTFGGKWQYILGIKPVLCRT